MKFEDYDNIPSNLFKETVNIIVCMLLLCHVHVSE